MTKLNKSFDPFIYEHLFHEYNLKITDQEINQILFLLRKNKHSRQQLTTYLSLNVLNFPLLKNLKKQITDILDQHKLFLTNNWAQLYNKGDKHDVHNHYGSIYSGIIYLKGENPNPTVFYDKNFDNYSYNFKKNTLLLFPSMTPHKVERLKENEERLIISFNTDRA